MMSNITVKDVLNYAGFAGDTQLGAMIEKWRKLSRNTKREILYHSCFVGMSDYDYEKLQCDELADYASDNIDKDFTDFDTNELVKILCAWRVTDK